VVVFASATTLDCCPGHLCVVPGQKIKLTTVDIFKKKCNTKTYDNNKKGNNRVPITEFPLIP